MSWSRPSLTLILLFIFAGWLCNTLWTIYSIYNLKPCTSGRQCLQASWTSSTPFLIFLCTSTSRRPFSSRMDLIYQSDQFLMDQPSKLSLSVPSASVPQNGSLFLHIILTKMRTTRSVSQQLLSEPNTVHAVLSLTKFAVVKPVSFSLLAESQKGKQSRGKRPVSHWKPAVVIDMALPISLDRRAIPGEIFDLVKVNNKAEYLPIIYYSELKFP